MRRWHFYDRQTGLFVGRSFNASTARDLAANTPGGCDAIEGAFDTLSQRVDLRTGQVVDDTELGAANRARIDGEEARARTSKRIAELDLLQVRSISALMINPEDREAREHFDRRRAEIDKLRAELSETESSGSEGVQE